MICYSTEKRVLFVIRCDRDCRWPTTAKIFAEKNFKISRKILPLKKKKCKILTSEKKKCADKIINIFIVFVLSFLIGFQSIHLLDTQRIIFPTHENTRVDRKTKKKKFKNKNVGGKAV